MHRRDRLLNHLYTFTRLPRLHLLYHVTKRVYVFFIEGKLIFISQGEAALDRVNHRLRVVYDGLWGQVRLGQNVGGVATH